MSSENTSREHILDRIVELELHMFERVRTAEPNLCQERPDAFKAMRRMTHSPLSTRTLASYLEDLNFALGEGKNLMTVKYARMEGKLVALKDSPLIEDIAEVEERWMKELSAKYPHVVKGGAEFRTYLTCELETYSDRTLDLYFRDVSNAEKEGRNLAEERYITLFKSLGYDSIAAAEAKAGTADTPD